MRKATCAALDLIMTHSGPTAHSLYRGPVLKFFVNGFGLRFFRVCVIVLLSVTGFSD